MLPRVGAFTLVLVSCAVAQDADLPRIERILNWSLPEKAVGFRNIRKIATVNRVARGGKATLFPRAEAELPVSYTLAGKAMAGKAMDTSSFMDANGVAGLLVLKDGRILLERYGLGLDQNQLWTSFSVAKSVTSILLGMAVAQGRIGSVDDPVVKYLPALRNTAYDGVTLRHILNMTSGVRWNEDYEDPESDVNRCHRSTDKSLGSPLVTYLSRLPREAPPGSKWVYKTAETDLIGEVVMAATRMSLSRYLSRNLWSKLGMEQDAFWMVKDGRELGGCCLNVSLRDYARFGHFILNDGRIGGRETLPPGWMREATQATSASKGSYGFQWWVSVDGPGTFTARGIFGQSIHLNPAEKLVIVVLSAWPKAVDPVRRAAVTAFVNAVAAQAAKR